MRRKNNGGVSIWIAYGFIFFSLLFVAIAQDPELGSSRVVFQTNYGDIEFGFYPTVAPQTVEHIFKLVRLGCYNTNHFFRVDKGFVAQVADVVGGRTVPMNEEQKVEADKTVVGEFSDVKHVRGILSMGRYADPNSAASSFSMLLGDAPHLDGQYAIFGKVTKGDETLRKLEQLPTRREGIFVMPTERITILSTYYYDCSRLGWLEIEDVLLHSHHKNEHNFQWRGSYSGGGRGMGFRLSHTKLETCEQEKSVLKRRLAASAVEVERQVVCVNFPNQPSPAYPQRQIDIYLCKNSYFS
ncbi:unnamed protein product [Camellia sinensis]